MGCLVVTSGLRSPDEGVEDDEAGPPHKSVVVWGVHLRQIRQYSRFVTTNTSPHPGKTMTSVFFQWTLKVFTSILLREK